MSKSRIALAFVRRASKADRRYIEAIEQAGGMPVPLWSDAEDWRQQLRSASGLLLTGGADIDPSLYGGDPAGCEESDPVRDGRELEALSFARAYNLPTLGICRGMQLINVFFGEDVTRGTLIADLPENPIRHRALADKSSAYHPVEVVRRTRLAAAVGGAGSFEVNSRHHQGLKSAHLGGGLVVAAVSHDGVVEGLEAPGEWFLLGVQCHPERPGEAPQFARVFAALLAAAAASAGHT